MTMVSLILFTFGVAALGQETSSEDPREILVLANRILAMEGLVGPYGHVSLRVGDEARFQIADHRSPDQVVLDYIKEVNLDITPEEAQARGLYREVFIHASIYRELPEVKAVVHTHAPNAVALGSLKVPDNKILPTKTAINKLRNILAGNVGGGTMDLVWGPELDFKESNSQVFKFLGSQKYEPVLNSIYAGLGIPPTLTGLAGNGGGFTNNFISLKTLVERLEYGRNVLLGFWNKEIEIVQRAMGFRFPARVHFDQMVLSDEAAEKNLLIQ